MLKPVGNRVVLEVIDNEEEKTQSGLVLTSASKEKPSTAKVVAVGEGKFLEGKGADAEVVVSVGDTVVFEQYAGTSVEVDGKEYLVVKEDNILAILN